MLRQKLFRWRAKYLSWTIPRRGSRPGGDCISVTDNSQGFAARPNFYWFKAAGRPAWLPCLTKPHHREGISLTNGWPEEHYFHRGLHGSNDWIAVIGQAHGELIRNEALEYSDIWDVVLVPKHRVSLSAEELAKLGDQLREYDADNYIAFVGDLWLGNTGWHPELPPWE